MHYLPEFITVATVHLLAAMAPGPDFVMITRNSLKYSRRTGLYSACGLAFGIVMHISYSLIGIGFMIAQSIVLFNVIKWSGAAYLIYIGCKSLKAKQQGMHMELIQNEKDLTRRRAVWMGFLTNVLNPKATLFFLALFTQVIDPHTPLIIQLLYGVEMSTMQFIWFGFVAVAFSHNRIKHRFVAVQHYAERAMGAVLVALGIKIALSSSK